MNTDKIEIKKIEALYNTLVSPLIAIFVLTLVTYYTFEGLVSQENLNIWLGLNLLLLVFRILSLIIYKKTTLTSKNVVFFYRGFFILSTLNAILWGASAFYILPDDIQYRIFILLYISGIISGAIISLSPKLEIFYVYLFTILVPYIYIFFIDDAETSRAYSFAIFLYLVVISSIARRMSKTLNDNIVLVFEKEDLVDRLLEKIEEATVASKAKSDFLSVMSHEIRTPLNAIIGFVNILKKGEEDSTKYKYLNTIEKSSNILTNVINDILDISKIESGKFSLEMKEFNPYKEFESLYLLFEQSALEKGINLVNNISPNLPQVLKSDIFRVKQIVSNLLSNAIKFTSLGKNIYLNIEFDCQNASLLVSVKDEGIGIAKTNILHITQAFTQADTSTARQYGGTGLGLSIVTNLLHLLKSELHIESALHQGSTFSFNINMQIIEGVMIKEDNDDENISFASKKILVAEDNKTNQMLISILLEDMDIDVTIANDGVIAIALFTQEEFDLVLMDINMPNKNGIDAMKEIKLYENEKELVPTPIVALTANAVSGDREKYQQDGFDEYVAKPIELSELVKVLKKNFKYD